MVFGVVEKDSSTSTRCPVAGVAKAIATSAPPLSCVFAVTDRIELPCESMAQGLRSRKNGVELQNRFLRK